jgi:hypothetical protein
MTEPVQLVDSLERIEGEGLASIEAAGSLEELEALRVRYLGRSGDLAGMLSRIGQAPAEDRRAIGQAANTAKRRLQEAHASRQTALERAESVGVAQADLTMPGRRAWEGGVHPVTRVIDPAADMWDTFYLADGVVLRSHTSPVQARIMETHEPPVRVVVPGLCYRRDPFDPTHAPAFEQIEGLAVDEGIDFVEFRSRPPLLRPGDDGSIPSGVLPLHRALRRGRRLLSHVRGIGLLYLQGNRLDRDHGLRNGAPGGVRGGRVRSGAVHGLRVWHGLGPDRHAQVRDSGHPALLRGRCPFSGAVSLVRRRGRIAVAASRIAAYV